MHADGALILGIETSCDETAAAVVRGGRQVLSNVISSQAAKHAMFGGVVPEIASREHLRHIVPVVRAAVAEAGTELQQLDAIAVTEGPGLAGALLVGISYAKALAFALGKPLIAVNHLEGHIHSALMGAGETSSPALALVVSGGHTHLYLAEREEPSGAWRYTNVGRTVDDAAGEAFDKVAKMLGLGYPGGPWISALAEHGDARAVPFSFAQVKAKAHRGQSELPEGMTHFSFSGIKTAVARYVELNLNKSDIEKRRSLLGPLSAVDTAAALLLCDAQTLGLIASFENAVVENLVRRTIASAEYYGATHILVTGGVAANRLLRSRFETASHRAGIQASLPPSALNTDNAAMIAAAAWQHLVDGRSCDVALTAQPALRLGSKEQIPAAPERLRNENAIAP